MPNDPPPPLPTRLGVGRILDDDDDGYMGLAEFDDNPWSTYVSNWNDTIHLNHAQFMRLWHVINHEIPEVYLPIVTCMWDW